MTVCASTLGAGAVVATTRYRWATRRALAYAGVLPRPANRLRNSAFARCANPGVPDRWGSPSAADVPDWSESFAVLYDDSHGLGSGMRTVRLTNPGPGPALRFQSHTTFVPEDRPYTFSVYLRSAGGELTTSLAMGWSEPTPVVVEDLWKRYHMTYTPTVEARRGIGLPARLELASPGTLFVAGPQLEAGTEPTPFALSLDDDLPARELAWDRSDEETSIAAAPAPAPPPASPQAVTVDRDRLCLTRGGTPFVVHSIAMRTLEPRQLDDVAAHGFDSVTIFPPALDGSAEDDAKIDRLREQLDAAHERSLGAVVCVGYDMKRTVEQLEADASRLLGALNRHPALLSWMLIDEPERAWRRGTRKAESQLLDYYAAARRADPDHPVFTCHLTWHDGRGGYGSLAASDLGAVQCYPIGWHSNPLKRIADLARAVNRDSAAAGKPSLFFLQLYGYDDAVREPTPDEHRAMTYLAFVRGTRLLCYYVYRPMSPLLWESTRVVWRELSRLETVVLDADARCVRVGTSARRAHYAVWELRGAHYVAACNASPEPVVAALDVARIAGRDVASAAAWYGEGAWRLADGALALALPPYGRQVVELS